MLEEKLELIANSLSNISRNLERLAEVFCGDAVVRTTAVPEGDTVVSVKKTPGRPRGRKDPLAPSDRDAGASGFAAPGGEGSNAAEAAGRSGTSSVYTAVTELDVRNKARLVLDARGWDVAEKIVLKYAKSGKVKDVPAGSYSLIMQEFDNALAERQL